MHSEGLSSILAAFREHLTESLPVMMRTAPSTPNAGSSLVSSVIWFDEGVGLAVAVGNVETKVTVEKTVEGGTVTVEPLDTVTDLDMVVTGSLVTTVVVAFCAQAEPISAARTSATSMVGSEVGLMRRSRSDAFGQGQCSR